MSPGRRQTSLRLQVDRDVLIATALATAPLILLVVLMHRYAIRAPWSDEFELVDDIRHLRDHTLDLGDLWRQHNEHRILFPRILMLTLAAATRWTIGLEIVVNLLLALVAFGLLVRLVAVSLPGRPLARLVIPVVFSWIFFSPIQWENWMWGWQIEWFLSVVGLMCTLLGLMRVDARGSGAMVFAGAGATLATYSLANGVLVWVAGTVVLASTGRPRRQIAGWILAAVLVAGPSYIRYADPHTGPKDVFLHEPLEFAYYVLLYLGAPLRTGPVAGAVFGGVLLCTFVGLVGVTLRCGDRTVRAGAGPWMAMGLYAVISAGLGGISRLSLGAEQALSSRYTTIAQLLLLACVMLAVLSFGHWHAPSPGRRLVPLVAVALVMLPVLANYRVALDGLQDFAPAQPEYRACVRAVRTVDDPCLVTAFPDPAYALRRIQYLQSIHWAGF